MAEHDGATPAPPVEDRLLGAVPPSSLPCVLEAEEVSVALGCKPRGNAVAHEAPATSEKLSNTSDRLVLSEAECVKHDVLCEAMHERA